ncbi:TetR/AcrR family transcriptional regulator [Streptomyces pseudovenezuelae]|uniref:AcrR family transcriptional regulator n=1 Tax=Streptomyces pseudovenezuelae TaxID=67350 RepID=A0ABT6LWW4_9ACTN|nr:TetR/AcrR family transcriptional regulator [Streptomyces pseudovenezuelae]MDH6220805.1 AcrR family transcriptional regulator [Streptomyces pseudovenezuelae]
MASTKTETPRERYRAQIRAEVKDHAWEQIATAGASGLSLNAIAKRMGMSGPALYRYFANRDELITELIKDGYRSLADTLHTAADSGADLTGLAHAMRRWALADPHRYFLLYGTPIPGYHAPDTTTAISAEIMSVLLDACVEIPVQPSPESAGKRFAEHLQDHRHWAHGHPATPEALHWALTIWTRLHGLLSLELAGHFNGMGFDPERLFDSELEILNAP